jgi:hypothetical protein
MYIDVPRCRQVAALARDEAAPVFFRSSALYVIGIVSVLVTGVPDLAPAMVSITSALVSRHFPLSGSPNSECSSQLIFEYGSCST